MQAIIDGESPAKPVNLIAAEFGVHISSLYNNVPDICKAVAKINAESRVKEARRRYVGLKERIHVLVHQYQCKGEYPSQDKIIGEIKINTKMVREVMNEVFWELGVQKKTF
ncbi:hypothetical protein [Geotalea sp. SG265]|uniref:hypothetical protein n=1 Tax=Geotalea sp. SG265 TaxID=2922867 RepID=UPI001FB0045C|nr:hypothetical protein [Geotalea sp. SG265]